MSRLPDAEAKALVRRGDQDWQRGVDTIAQLLGAPVWTPARTELALRELERVDPTSWAGREAVVVDDRFVLLEILSAGARSTVLAGVDLATRSDVAVKIVLPTASFAAHRRELEREVEILASLRHEHVVELLGHGHCGALPYLATRRMTGGALHGWLATEPSLDARLWVLRDACAGLDAAVELGVTHGDVKPPNILVSGQGRGCLCDWGSARRQTDVDELARAATGLFASPERWARPDAPSPAGDVFSLGLCVAFAVRGRHEVPSESDRGNHDAWLALALADLEPPWLVELVARCLAADPRERPSAGELATVLPCPALERSRTS